MNGVISIYILHITYKIINSVSSLLFDVHFGIVWVISMTDENQLFLLRSQ